MYRVRKWRIVRFANSCTTTRKLMHCNRWIVAGAMQVIQNARACRISAKITVQLMALSASPPTSWGIRQHAATLDSVYRITIRAFRFVFLRWTGHVLRRAAVDFLQSCSGKTCVTAQSSKRAFSSVFCSVRANDGMQVTLRVKTVCSDKFKARFGSLLYTQHSSSILLFCVSSHKRQLKRLFSLFLSIVLISSST